MDLNAECLLCNKKFKLKSNPIFTFNSPELKNNISQENIDVCPQCGDAYYLLNGKDGGCVIENCCVDNRELIKRDKGISCSNNVSEYTGEHENEETIIACNRIELSDEVSLSFSVGV